MLERIAVDDPLWADPPYEADGPLFDVMHRISEAEDGLFLTDRHTVLMAQSAPDRDMWIWTAPGAQERLAREVRAACDAYGVLSITARASFACAAFADWRVYHPAR